MYQWLSLSTEALFLQNGLHRVTDLLDSPNHDSTGATNNEEEIDHHIQNVFETGNPTEISQVIEKICRGQRFVTFKKEYNSSVN